MKKPSNNKKLLAIFFGCCVLCMAMFLAVWSSIPKTPKPIIVVSDMSLCILQNGQKTVVANYEKNVEMHICADLETNTYPIRLTLIIESKKNFFDTYTYADSFVSGPVTFTILDQLPAGIYRARIMWARDTLADISFSVDE